MPIITTNIPTELNRAEVRGVFVGGCVERGDGSRFRAKAHAHMSGPYSGWVCYLSTKWLGCRELALHELAHILQPGGHTDKWRAKLVSIGGTLEPVFIGNKIVLRSYQKHMRGSHG